MVSVSFTPLRSAQRAPLRETTVHNPIDSLTLAYAGIQLDGDLRGLSSDDMYVTWRLLPHTNSPWHDRHLDVVVPRRHTHQEVSLCVGGRTCGFGAIFCFNHHRAIRHWDCRSWRSNSLHRTGRPRHHISAYRASWSRAGYLSTARQPLKTHEENCRSQNRAVAVPSQYSRQHSLVLPLP